MIPTIGDQVEVLIDDIKYKATITHIEMSFYMPIIFILSN